MGVELIVGAVVGLLLWLILTHRTKVTKYIQMCNALRDVQGPKPHWLRGDIRQKSKLEQNPLKILNDGMKQYKNYQRRWLGPYGGLMVYAPNSIQNVLTNLYHKGEFGYSLLKPFLGDSLVTGNGLKWKHDRKMLNPVFHTSAMSSYIHVFNKSAKTLTDQLKTKKTISIPDAFSKLALDIITQCALSMQTNCQEEGTLNAYKNAVDAVGEIFLERFLNLHYRSDWIFSKTELYKKQVESLKILRGHAFEVISERRQHTDDIKRDHSNKKRTDFLDILLNSVNMEGEKLSDEEIIFHIHTFMIAGHETTATALTWLFYFLTKYPEHQDNCREEIKEVLGERNEVTWAHAQKLNYLTMCIKETLRLRNPVCIFGRSTTSDMKITDILGDEGNKDVVLPEGAIISVNLNNLHRNPEVWENPDEFNPLRFEKKNASKLHPFAFIPFSAGPRNCIGQHFAMLEMKVAAGLILKNIKFETGKDFVEPKIKLEIVLKPAANFCLEVRNVE